MFAADADNRNANSNNTIFTIKSTESYVTVVTSPAKDIKNYQSSLAKDLKDQFIGMNIKQKMRPKIKQMNIDIFSNQFLVELINHLF